MPVDKSRLKTAPLTLRIKSDIKAAAEIAAVREHRSLTNLIEVLILRHCEGVGIKLGTDIKEELS